MKRNKRKLKLLNFFNKRNNNNKSRKKSSGKNDEFLRLLF